MGLRNSKKSVDIAVATQQNSGVDPTEAVKVKELDTDSPPPVASNEEAKENVEPTPNGDAEHTTPSLTEVEKTAAPEEQKQEEKKEKVKKKRSFRSFSFLRREKKVKQQETTNGEVTKKEEEEVKGEEKKEEVKEEPTLLEKEASVETQNKEKEESQQRNEEQEVKEGTPAVETEAVEEPGAKGYGYTPDISSIVEVRFIKENGNQCPAEPNISSGNTTLESHTLGSNQDMCNDVQPTDGEKIRDVSAEQDFVVIGSCLETSSAESPPAEAGMLQKPEKLLLANLEFPEDEPHLIVSADINKACTFETVEEDKDETDIDSKYIGIDASLERESLEITDSICPLVIKSDSNALLQENYQSSVDGKGNEMKYDVEAFKAVSEVRVIEESSLNTLLSRVLSDEREPIQETSSLDQFTEACGFIKQTMEGESFQHSVEGSFVEPASEESDFMKEPVEEVMEKNFLETVEQYVEDPVEKTVGEIAILPIEEAVIETADESVEVFATEAAKISIGENVETADTFIKESVPETADKSTEETVAETADKFIGEPVADTFIKEPVAETADTFIKEPVAETADTFIKEPVAETADTFIKEPDAETADTFIKAPVAETADTFIKEPVAETADTFIKEPVAETADTFIKEPVAETADTFIKEPVAETADTFIKEPVTETADPFIKEPVTETADPFIKEPVTETADPFIKEPVTETADTFIKEPVTETADTFIKEPVTETADTYIKEFVAETAGESAEERLAKTAGESAEERLAKTAGESAEERLAKTADRLAEERLAKTLDGLTEETVKFSIGKNVVETAEISNKETVKECDFAVCSDQVRNPLELTKEILELHIDTEMSMPEITSSKNALLECKVEHPEPTELAEFLGTEDLRQSDILLESSKDSDADKSSEISSLTHDEFCVQALHEPKEFVNFHSEQLHSKDVELPNKKFLKEDCAATPLPQVEREPSDYDYMVTSKESDKKSSGDDLSKMVHEEEYILQETEVIEAEIEEKPEAAAEEETVEKKTQHVKSPQEAPNEDKQVEEKPLEPEVTKEE